MLQAPNPATCVSLLPGASRDEKWKSPTSQVGARLLKVSGSCLWPPLTPRVLMEVEGGAGCSG